jgi:phosphatidylinositol alpha-1,6-mannosyltransferase
MAPDDRVSARFVLDLALHLTAHAKVFVLAPAGPNTRPRESWGDVTVLRYRYWVPASQQRLAAGEGMVATMRASPLARAQAPALVAAQWLALPRVVRRERIDLINAHWIVPQGMTAAQWRARLKVPVVVTAHGADVAWLDRTRHGRRIARYVFDRADGFIADSQYLATRTEEIVGRAIPHAAIPMGVTTSLFQPEATASATEARDARRTLLFVGKLVPKKGVSVLVDAVRLLRDSGRPIRLVLIGGGPLEADIRAQVERLGLGDTVELVGWVKNDALPTHYRAADVVCVPSVQDAAGETEGTPVVLQEAMASGAVVVASRSSGISDVVRDGVNGWSVPPGDAKALADAISGALDMTETDRERIRAAARETAGGHSWDRVAARFMETFVASAGRAAFK